jgi:hypothetical protein
MRLCLCLQPCWWFETVELVFKLFLTSLLPFVPFEQQLVVGEYACRERLCVMHGAVCDTAALHVSEFACVVLPESFVARLSPHLDLFAA